MSVSIVAAETGALLAAVEFFDMAQQAVDDETAEHYLTVAGIKFIPRPAPTPTRPRGPAAL